MSLRVGFDMDGVLADFRSAFARVAEDAGLAPETSGPDMRQAWEYVKRTPNWWTTLQPYEADQIARLYELTRRLRWEVVFMTKRPTTLGDTIQAQTQWWLEQYGFYYPAVVTVPGSRGELANAVRLDIAVDDQLLNCVDIIGGSTAKALLLDRDSASRTTREHATNRGIGVVATLDEALDVITHLHESVGERRGRLQRLADWFGGTKETAPAAAGAPARSRMQLRQD